MNESFVNQIRNNIQGQILQAEPLHQHTWYRIGGPCDLYCIPQSIPDLHTLVQMCRDANIPFFVLGKGSNLLVSDEGLRGVVLNLSSCCLDLEFNGNQLHVGAGWYMPKLVLECEKRGLGGIERFAGIPGTVGGALKMNAGCHGREMYDVVHDVTFLQNGETQIAVKNELEVEYRHVRTFDDASTVILSSTWTMTPESPDRLSEARKQYMKKRQETQPINLPSSGSVFRNPSGDHAARLIETAGLKGHSVGGAAISDKHANFIVNVNRATANDVLELMKKARHEVFEKFGVLLELEVKLVGFETDEISELV